MNGVTVMDGREWPLRFSVNHVCAMEEAEGMPLPSLLNSGMRGLRALLWCGLMDEHITRQQAGEMLQRYFSAGGSVKEISRCLSDALMDAGYFSPPGEEV